MKIKTLHLRLKVKIMTEVNARGGELARMNEPQAEANAAGQGYQPQDWHAVEQRAVAEANVQILRELPMNDQNADEVIREVDPADILRKATYGIKSNK